MSGHVVNTVVRDSMFINAPDVRLHVKSKSRVSYAARRKCDQKPNCALFSPVHRYTSPFGAEEPWTTGLNCPPGFRVLGNGDLNPGFLSINTGRY